MDLGLKSQGVKAHGQALDVADGAALKSWVEASAAALGGANGVVFVSSPAASRISGTNLVIDGALTVAV